MTKPNILALFCEDIREEKSDQITLVGIFPDNLNVGAPIGSKIEPGSRPVLPKLSIYLRFNFEIDGEMYPYKANLVMADGNKIPIGEVSTELIQRARQTSKEKRTTLAGLTLRTAIANVPLVQPGPIHVEVTDGEKVEIVGGVTFNYEIEEGSESTSTEQRQPSSQ